MFERSNDEEGWSVSEQATHHHDILDLPDLSAVPPHLQVAVFHQDEIMRCGLETLLQALPHIGAVHVLDTPALGGTALLHHRPDIVLLPASLAPELLRDLVATAHRAGAKALLMLTALDRTSIQRTSHLAADGFVLEAGLTAETLAHTVQSVLRGDIPVPPSLVRELLSEVNSQGHNDRGPQLTPREEDTLTLLVQGMSNKQIARRLGISEHGAKRHVSNVLAKLHCPNRTVAAVVAVKNGLIPAPVY
ncbi:response regulator transcription factor [Streptomyces purpurogeneiscleroticus]|uniref:response regulator transcription factor n=1 Tax=Streptomyces purpurogeneiscleroticus TaxID=68259 RepID=UPI001CBFC210|nr:response regulator transcription factor [Streptomyces purpurogeneiscleroticus]MBZ4016081.1 hypothetical protein [Streptomyces purpurogeneiscleroticus]